MALLMALPMLLSAAPPVQAQIPIQTASTGRSLRFMAYLTNSLTGATGLTTGGATITANGVGSTTSILMASTTGLQVGQQVIGATGTAGNIGAKSWITAVTVNTSVTLSPALPSATANADTFTSSLLVVKLVKEGSSTYAPPVGALTEIANGLYQIAGNATDTNTSGALWLNATASTIDPTNKEFNVQAVNVDDATRMGLTSLPNALPAATGGLITVGSGSGQLLPNGTGGINATSSSITTVNTGTATAGGASTITLQSGASTVTDIYKGNYVLISSGTGAGQSRVISGYTSGLVATVSRAWTVQPATDSVYYIIANPHPAMDANLAVVASSVTGNVGRLGGFGDGQRGRHFGNHVPDEFFCLFD